MSNNILKIPLISICIIATTSNAQIEDSLLDQIKGGQSTLQNIDKVSVFNQVDKISETIMPENYEGLDISNNIGQSIQRKLSNLSQNSDLNSNELDTNAVSFDKERRDPFALTGFMLERYSDNRSGSVTNFTALSNIKMPPLSLKGILKKSENEEMVALLKVGNKGVYLVRVGDTIGFREGVNDHVMRIKSIEHQSIIVEAGNLGQVIVVR